MYQKVIINPDKTMGIDMVGLGILEYIIQTKIQDLKGEPEQPCLECIEKGKKLIPELVKKLGPVAENGWNRFQENKITGKQFIRILRLNYTDEQVEDLVNELLRQMG